MEGLDDAEEFRWAANLGEVGEETLSADQIEGLGQIDEGGVQRLALLSAFFLQFLDGVVCAALQDLCGEAIFSRCLTRG